MDTQTDVNDYNTQIDTNVFRLGPKRKNTKKRTIEERDRGDDSEDSISTDGASEAKRQRAQRDVEREKSQQECQSTSECDGNNIGLSSDEEGDEEGDDGDNDSSSGSAKHKICPGNYMLLNVIFIDICPIGHQTRSVQLVVGACCPIGIANLDRFQSHNKFPHLAHTQSQRPLVDLKSRSPHPTHLDGSPISHILNLNDFYRFSNLSAESANYEEYLESKEATKCNENY